MRVWQFIKKEAVLSVASLAAIISMFFVPPSLSYIGYIDFRTLALLLALMLTVAGAKKAGVFEILISSCFSVVKGRRGMILLLVSFCFFSSMLITNDVALITFVPPAIMVFGTQLQTLMITVVLMTVAANLGSMLTPVGNPQNLFLFSYYEMSIGEFFAVTAP
ncbi:MAG: anion permease, partial [Oscillospiraceae bacterium]|nr:anion permease [Oscillospiraceae bacterium]